ncbi:hypothetical protein HHK36_018636 [Tetracentron sinense]|uniref:Uncharacterized protein n=1 Tax=Tetracentron sinense TaxID=13715 RepID=A0A834Z2K1_TETSI|nr:hypothetical protein HHK36_018636 [Tetracentron sinense]
MTLISPIRVSLPPLVCSEQKHGWHVSFSLPWLLAISVHPFLHARSQSLCLFFSCFLPFPLHLSPFDLFCDKMAAAAFEHPSNLAIPIDLFVSKKLVSLKYADLSFSDADDNLIFTVDDRSSKSTPRNKRVLLDAQGNPLFSIYRDDGGSWQGFRGDCMEWKDLIFRVERTLHSLSRTELEVFLVLENLEDSKSDFKLKGCPFQRSCTIYNGDSIVAQVASLELNIEATQLVFFFFFLLNNPVKLDWVTPNLLGSLSGSESWVQTGNLRIHELLKYGSLAAWRLGHYHSGMPHLELTRRMIDTNLLYKLGKVIVGRRKFRLTIFPGFSDHALVVALLVIFFDGRK